VADLTFDRSVKQIFVEGSGDQTVTIQELYDKFIDYLDEPRNMDLVHGIEAAGKQDLRPANPGTKLVGVTITLKDGWQVIARAADHTGPGIDTITILDGNITALDALSVGQVPVVGVAFVAYNIESDVSAGLVSGTTSAIAASLATLEENINNRKDIDFVGDDAAGWQEVAYEGDGTTVAQRWNLFDNDGVRINETVSSFVLRNGMIASRVPTP